MHGWGCTYKWLCMRVLIYCKLACLYIREDSCEHKYMDDVRITACTCVNRHVCTYAYINIVPGAATTICAVLRSHVCGAPNYHGIQTVDYRIVVM